MPPASIYGMARTRAFRALWVAMELGIDYEHIPVEIGDAGARTPEFLAINPNGRLPAIVDDGFVLVELLAITLYLAKKQRPDALSGTIQGEAKAWQWTLWAVTEVDRGVNIWSLHAVRLPPAERNAAKLAEALQVIAGPFKVLDEAVSKQPYSWATNSPSPTSTSPPSSAGRSKWTFRDAAPEGVVAALPGPSCGPQSSCAQGAVGRRNIVRGDAANRQAQPVMSGPDLRRQFR